MVAQRISEISECHTPRLPGRADDARFLSRLGVRVTQQLVEIVRLSALTMTIAAIGCGRVRSGPTREVIVPGGGPVVLTSAERNARGLPPATEQTGLAARASFEQPLELPPRLRRFDEWSESEAAAEALGRIGEAAVPELIRVLESQDPVMRRKAIEVLGRMGSGAAAAAPELEKLLDDPDPQVRKAAVRTLGQIGPAAGDAVPALMRTLLQPALLPVP